EDADRFARHQMSALRGGRIDGWHAGARMGRELSGHGALRHSCCNDVAAQRPADCIQRSRPPGDHGGPRLEQGDYYDTKPPGRGLSVARMVGHITYMSDDSMREKFGRRLREKDKLGFDFGVDFEVESYLRYRGSQFVTRFDANSYLYITKAEDYFDLTNGTGRLVDAFGSLTTRFLVISFTSDWLYPSYQSQEIARVLRRVNGDVAYCDLRSNYGHDAFLVDIAEQTDL